MLAACEAKSSSVPVRELRTACSSSEPTARMRIKEAHAGAVELQVASPGVSWEDMGCKKAGSAELSERNGSRAAFMIVAGTVSGLGGSIPPGWRRIGWVRPVSDGAVAIVQGRVPG